MRRAIVNCWVDRWVNRRVHRSRWLSLLGFCGALASFNAAAQPSDSVLRVCSDPDNLPLSHENGEGYENRIATEIAKDLGRRLEYTYFPQRMGFVRNTLRSQDPNTRAYKCDLIIGVPDGYELTATTQPYMRSTYAMLYTQRKGLNELKAPDDLLKLPAKELSALRIGIFEKSPGADWLLRNNLLHQAVSFAAQSGDPHETPTSIIDRELSAGNIDVAIVWGPIAGHLLRKHAEAGAWRAVPFARDPNIKFDYAISMGVRRGEKAWQSQLDEWIASHRDRIHEILVSHGVPLLDESGNLTSGFQSQRVEDVEGVQTRLAMQSESQAQNSRIDSR